MGYVPFECANKTYPEPRMHVLQAYILRALLLQWMVGIGGSGGLLGKTLEGKFKNLICKLKLREETLYSNHNI